MVISYCRNKKLIKSQFTLRSHQCRSTSGPCPSGILYFKELIRIVRCRNLIFWLKVKEDMKEGNKLVSYLQIFYNVGGITIVLCSRARTGTGKVAEGRFGGQYTEYCCNHWSSLIGVIKPVLLVGIYQIYYKKQFWIWYECQIRY